MKKFRMVIGLIVLALLVALVPASMAQEMTFGLSQEDFAALAAANSASASATSAQFDFTLDLSLAGAPDTGEVVMNITGTGLYDTTAEVFQLTLGGSVTAEGETTPVELEIRAVDDAIYFNGPLATQGQWQGMTSSDLEGMVEQFSSQLPVSPEQFLGGEDADPAQMEAMSNAFASLATLQPEDYIAMARNGEQFTVTLDIAGLASSEEFTNFIIGMAAASGEAAGTSEGEMAAAAAMLGTLFQDSSFTINQWVGADSLVSRTDVDLALSIDPAMIGETGDPVAVAFSFDINLSGYNGSYTVEAPADATMMGAS